MEDHKKNLSRYSAIASYLLLVFLAYRTEVFHTIWYEVVLLITGRVADIPIRNLSFIDMLPYLAGVIVTKLLLSISTLPVIFGLVGKPNKAEHEVSKMMDEMKLSNLFTTFFIIVLLEELFARWLFLRMLPQIPFLSGTVAFYVLFLIGNGIWAWVHVFNYKNHNDRQLIRVLPQFIGGIFFTYVFVKFGLLAAVLTHFACNAVLFAGHKVQRVNYVDGLIVAYSAICFLVSMMLMQHPITDILPWFANTPTFVIAGWEFWDYVLLSTAVVSGLSVLLGLLAYDRGEAGQVAKIKQDIPVQVIFPVTLVVFALGVGIVFGLFKLFGLVTVDVPYRVLAIAICGAFLSRGASGSAMSRTFWMGLMNGYISVCVIQALGFWLAIAWIAVSTVIFVPRALLIMIDD